MSSRTLLAAAAVAALSPLGAWADSGVAIQARSYAGGNGPGGETIYAWNYYADGAYISHQSATSTGSVTGNATSATATAPDIGTGGQMGSSTISGDLASASMSASVANAGYTYGQLGDGGHPWGQIQDQLTFAAAGASSATVSTIGVTFTLHDTITGANPYANGSYLYGTVAVGGKDACGQLYVGDTGVVTPSTDTYPSAWNGVWTTTRVGDGYTLTYDGQISFSGARWSTSFLETIEAYCWNGAQCTSDSSVAFSLPQGVTMTSESGVFLTAGSPSAVPEPQNALLLLAGLGALGAAARRRARG